MKVILFVLVLFGLCFLGLTVLFYLRRKYSKQLEQRVPTDVYEDDGITSSLSAGIFDDDPLPHPNDIHDPNDWGDDCSIDHSSDCGSD